MQENYRLFLLSNTNVIHYQYFTSQDYWNKSLFEKVYFSQILGMRKPEQRIYKFVLADAGLRAEETMFIDDNSDNVSAARAIGIKAYQLTGEILDFFDMSIDFYKY